MVQAAAPSEASIVAACGQQPHDSSSSFSQELTVIITEVEVMLRGIEMPVPTHSARTPCGEVRTM